MKGTRKQETTAHCVNLLVHVTWPFWAGKPLNFLCPAVVQFLMLMCFFLGWLWRGPSRFRSLKVCWSRPSGRASGCYSTRSTLPPRKHYNASPVSLRYVPPNTFFACILCLFYVCFWLSSFNLRLCCIISAGIHCSLWEDEGWVRNCTMILRRV